MLSVSALWSKTSWRKLIGLLVGEYIPAPTETIVSIIGFLRLARAGQCSKKCSMVSFSWWHRRHTGSTQFWLNVARFVCRIYVPVRSLSFVLIREKKSRPLLCPRDQIPGWSLPYNNGQRLKVQTVLVWKQQGYCWCWSVCGGEVDREGIWGQASLRPDHPGEDHSRPAGALSSVCLCPTVWSQWFCKGSILRPT